MFDFMNGGGGYSLSSSSAAKVGDTGITVGGLTVGAGLSNKQMMMFGAAALAGLLAGFFIGRKG